MNGNQSKYDSSNVVRSENKILDNKNVLFLGYSVTFGAASLQDGIPEYFRHRLGCVDTKEAISGTTLVDNGPDSYVARLKSNIDVNKDYALVICQLSTNDATRGLPLGEIAAGPCAASTDSNEAACTDSSDATGTDSSDAACTDSSDAASTDSSDATCLDSFDTSTITGAMEYIIAYSRMHWHCPIMFYTGSRYESENYEKMVTRLFELAEKWNIGVLDLWTDDAFNDISDEDRALFMADPIHPTKAGYMTWWCPEMEKQLIQYLEK